MGAIVMLSPNGSVASGCKIVGRSEWPLILILIALVWSWPLVATTQSEEMKNTFDQAMSKVKVSANNSAAEAAAMERVIEVVRGMATQPPIPDLVIDHQGRGEAAVRMAKSRRDFLDAANAFGEAARLAPWQPENHFNRGVVLEKAERFDEAERAFKLYLKAAPGAKNNVDVRKRIAGLQYAKEKEEKAALEEASKELDKLIKSGRDAAPSATPSRQEVEQLVRSLAGRWNNSCAAPNTIPGNPYELIDAGPLSLNWRAWNFFDKEWSELGNRQGFFVYDFNTKKLIMNNRVVAGQRREIVIQDRNTLKETFTSGGGIIQNCTWRRIS